MVIEKLKLIRTFANLVNMFQILKTTILLSFGNLNELVVEGEKAAEKYGYILANLSSPKDFKETKDKALKEEPIQINKIKLEGNNILTFRKS